MLHILHAFVDCVLMGAGESGKYQIARIGVAGMHLHFGALFIYLADMAYIAEIQFRIHTLGIHIHGYVHDIRISGTLTIAEERTFHTFSASHNSQLRCCCSAASVIMGMEADNSGFPVFQMTAEIFDLVCVRIGGGHFYRIGQIEDYLFLGGSAQRLQHPLADFHGIVYFRSGEALREYS